MSHNLKENGEDVSGIDDVFDDNKDNIDKFPSGESSVTDSKVLHNDNEKDSEQDVFEEESEPAQGEGLSGPEEEKSEITSPDVSTSIAATGERSGTTSA